jgi:hypothetical protein
MEYSIHSNISQTENERKKVKEAFEDSEHEHSAVVAEVNPHHTPSSDCEQYVL